MTTIARESPNHGKRPDGMLIDCVVLHATADENTMGSVEWCCTPKPTNPNPVSYHAIIDRDGTVYALVAPDRRAWHAGVSSFQGAKNVNDFSIGVSFANKNDGREAYTQAQLEAGAFLVAGYMRTYPIPLDRITTHAAIALPVGRKTDPLGFPMSDFRALVAGWL